MLGLLRKSKFSLEKLSLNSLMLLRDTMGISSPVWVPAGVQGTDSAGKADGKETEKQKDEKEKGWLSVGKSRHIDHLSVLSQVI